jgi:Ser/Thr protein kinase RdoA (MazF antagonist)
MNDEEKLNDGVNIVVRVGNTIRRTPGKWTPSVHVLLKHLRTRGFLSAPEPLGFDEKGREILSYIEGEVGAYTLTPAARSNAALVSAAKLLRAYHDATVDFVSSYRGDWQLDNHPPLEVICHGDYAPYNCVYSKDKIIGMLDFDMAHPGSRIWDVAYAVYRFAPITAPDNQDGFGTCQEQADRVRLFCDAYNLQGRENLIPTVLERISALLDFLYSRANEGNKIYQKFVAEGHDQIYLNDLNYIMSNQEFFIKNTL